MICVHCGDTKRIAIAVVIDDDTFMHLCFSCIYRARKEQMKVETLADHMARIPKEGIEEL